MPKKLRPLRKELELEEIHLFGHSCGATLAAEYMATNPKGIKSIIFASPVISTKKYLEDGHQLKLQLPPSIRNTLFFMKRTERCNPRPIRMLIWNILKYIIAESFLLMRLSKP